MRFAKLIDIGDLKTLLDSEYVGALEAEMSKSSGLKILPMSDFLNFAKKISGAELTLDEVYKILENDHIKLKHFISMLFPVRDGDEQEYSDNEEPDENDKDAILEVLGFQNGASIVYLCKYKILKHNDGDYLNDYLKWLKIPNHGKYSAELRRAYKKLPAIHCS